ncbi:hypothetical protein FZC78_09440 [Rossellomorea vietnamensis]|uniref:Uncharacterized protein n=1 Tax=Rossellomorea vietnamensis TaxID=218284 RepID=A0A5D4NWF4_9BACI|nr:hypothetical protein [Rossellomorea vietnamensis]TYS18041.1 hypothetical protein FZC78_09440 [Rossellomorea vietnamensis]
MKKYFIITQVVYVLFLMPWLLIFGLSFMSFDQGIVLANSLFVASIGIYPIVMIGCSLAAWILHRKKGRLAAILNGIPMLWVLGLSIPLLLINL